MSLQTWTDLVLNYEFAYYTPLLLGYFSVFHSLAFGGEEAPFGFSVFPNVAWQFPFKKVRFVDMRTSYPIWPGVVVQNAVKVSFVDDRNELHLNE